MSGSSTTPKPASAMRPRPGSWAYLRRRLGWTVRRSEPVDQNAFVPTVIAVELNAVNTWMPDVNVPPM